MVPWSDDMKIEVVGLAHQWWIWRWKKEAYAEKKLVKYGDGS
jgi:hypothetical protein